MRLLAGREPLAEEEIAIVLEGKGGGEVLVHKGGCHIPADAVLRVAVVDAVAPVFAAFDASAQLQHIPEHAYAGIQADGPIPEIGMVGIAVNELIVLAIDVGHDGIVAKIILIAQAYVPLTLAVIQAEGGAIKRIGLQVRIAAFRLQGVGKLLYGAQLRKRRIHGIYVSVERQAPLLVDGIRQVEARVERIGFVVLLPYLLKPGAGEAHSEAIVQFAPFAVVLRIGIRIGLLHLRGVLQRAAVLVVSISLRVAYACTQTAFVFKAFLVDAFGNERVFFTTHARIVIHHGLFVQQLGVAAAVSGVDIGAHHVEGEELPVLQVLLEVEVEVRDEVTVVVPLRAVGYGIGILLGIEFSPHPQVRVVVMREAEGGVQHIFVGLLQVVGDGAPLLEVLLLAPYGMLVAMIAAAVCEGECLLLVIPYPVEELQAVAVVEADFGLLEVHFTRQVMVAESALQTLCTVVAHGASHFVSPHDVVHHRARIAVAQPRVFLKLHANNLFGQQGGNFFFRGFPPIDTELHAATVAHGHAAVEGIDAQAGQHQMAQHIHAIVGGADLLFIEEHQLAVGTADAGGGGDGDFAQFLRSVFEGECTYIGCTFEALQVEIQGLIADAGNHQPIISGRYFLQFEVAFLAGSGSGYKNRVGSLQHDVSEG